MKCEQGCILAIVGSRDLMNNDDAWDQIRATLVEHDPVMVITGDARGIDKMTERACIELGYLCEVLHPVPLPPSDATGKWFEDSGVKARNLKLADACHCMVRIYSDTTKTFGSGWTLAQAARLGKRTEEKMVVNRP